MAQTGPQIPQQGEAGTLTYGCGSPTVAADELAKEAERVGHSTDSAAAWISLNAADTSAHPGKYGAPLLKHAPGT